MGWLRELPLLLMAWGGGGSIRPMGAARIVVATAVITSAVVGVRLTTDGGGSAPDGTANIWIESGAGACAGGRSATPITYEESASPDRRCGDPDDAWDAMNAGDTARVVAGTWTTDWAFDGHKASETFIIGPEDPTDVVLDGVAAINANGDYLTIENVTVDHTGESCQGNQDVRIEGDHVTLRNFNLWGERAALITWPAGNNGDFFTWDGGDFGEPGVDGLPRQECDGEPIWLEGDDATIRNVTYQPQFADSGYHLEHIRIQGAQNVTIDGVVFPDGSDIGSGYIFVTNSTSSSTAANNLHVVNTSFGRGVSGSLTMQCHANVTSSTGWVFAYNTWQVPISEGDGALIGGGCDTGDIHWVGNLGSKGLDDGCGGTHEYNVWQNNADPTCDATDTWVSGTTNEVNNLGINADDIHIDAGSPAIDAGETPGASDYCTGSIVNSTDVDLGTRPQNSVCDAGADERGTP